jgi:hypothetical protein
MGGKFFDRHFLGAAHNPSDAPRLCNECPGARIDNSGERVGGERHDGRVCGWLFGAVPRNLIRKHLPLFL